MMPGFSSWLWGPRASSESRMEEQKPSQMKRKVDLGYSDLYYSLLTYIVLLSHSSAVYFDFYLSKK